MCVCIYGYCSNMVSETMCISVAHVTFVRVPQRLVTFITRIVPIVPFALPSTPFSRNVVTGINLQSDPFIRVFKCWIHNSLHYIFTDWDCLWGEIMRQFRTEDNTCTVDNLIWKTGTCASPVGPRPSSRPREKAAPQRTLSLICIVNLQLYRNWKLLKNGKVY